MSSVPAPATAAAEKQPDKAVRSPWLWIPSLYFSQGIPYVIVMTMSVVMYKRLGISNTDIALYTSWLYLPWVIKPLWSPLVDINRTKRFWVVSMQFLVSIGLALVALSVRGSGFFQLSLALLWIMAFASSTHDIAADGFYMLSLSKHEQAWWVGMRSTFYRTAMIVGSGLLVVLAGTLESRNGLPPVELTVSARADAVSNSPSTPPPAGTVQPGETKIVSRPGELRLALLPRTADEARIVLDSANLWNREHGFFKEERSAPKAARRSWWSQHISEPLGRSWSANLSRPLEQYLKNRFPNKTQSKSETKSGNLGVAYLNLSKPPEPGQDIVVNVERKKNGLQYVGLAKGDKGFQLVLGERLNFDASNWNIPAAVVIQLDPKLKVDSSVRFLATSGNIPVAWSITLLTVAGLFFAFTCWHAVILPRPANDRPVRMAKGMVANFAETLGSFFRKPGVWMALAFILLYRFDEAQLGKVISPFLLDGREAGGLGLSTSQVGLAYGTFGILALTCGGLLGGFSAAKHGLKKMLPIMVCSMYLPKLAFVVLSWLQPDNFLLICGAIALEQFGYGFGFTAFMLYMLYFADGPHKTAHYAICTGFMALGMMVPGMWSGWVADIVGYKHFFVWVIVSTLPGITLAMLLKVDPQFGKKVA